MPAGWCTCAWSRMKRVAWPIECGPGVVSRPSRTSTSMSASAAASSTTSSARPCAATLCAGRPSRRSASASSASAASPETVVQRASRSSRRRRPSGPGGPCARSGCGTCSSVVSVAGRRGGGVHARLPAALRDPHEHLQVTSHSAIVAPMRTGGTRERAEHVEVAVRRLGVAGGQDAPPQQRGQRPRVGQVRAGVDADRARRARSACRRRRPRAAARAARGGCSAGSPAPPPARPPRAARAARGRTGTMSLTRSPSPCAATPATITPRPSTNPSSGRSTAAAIARGRWRSTAIIDQRPGGGRPGGVEAQRAGGDEARRA